MYFWIEKLTLTYFLPQRCNIGPNCVFFISAKVTPIAKVTLIDGMKCYTNIQPPVNEKR